MAQCSCGIFLDNVHASVDSLAVGEPPNLEADETVCKWNRTYAIVAVARLVRWELSQKYTHSSDTNWKVCATNEQTA